MAKWGISKRGKRYYNLRDGDGQFTDDGIPNGSIPSLSDVAQARVANTLRNSAGFRKPSNKDKTASTTRYTGAKSESLSNRPIGAKLGYKPSPEAKAAADRAKASRESDTPGYTGPIEPGTARALNAKIAKRNASNNRAEKARLQKEIAADRAALLAQDKKENDLVRHRANAVKTAQAEVDELEKMLDRDGHNPRAQLEISVAIREAKKKLDDLKYGRDQDAGSAKAEKPPVAGTKLSNAEISAERKNAKLTGKQIAANNRAEARAAKPPVAGREQWEIDQEALGFATTETARGSVKRDAQAEEDEKNARIARELANAGKPPVAGKKLSRDARDAQNNVEYLEDMLSREKNPDARNRIENDLKRAKSVAKYYGVGDSSSAKPPVADARPLKGPVRNPKPSNEDIQKQMRDVGMNAQVRPKRAPKLPDNVLEEMDRLDGREDTDSDALNAVRQSLANGHVDDAIEAAWGGGLEDLAEKLESFDKAPEGKDARSMTAAEKLAAGRAMYGDKVSKQKGFDKLQKAADAEATPSLKSMVEDVTQARQALIRATRTMKPEERQKYYNEKATNGTPAEKDAAKSMGGRPTNAPGTHKPSTVGLSPERQRLEATRKASGGIAEAERERIAERVKNYQDRWNKAEKARNFPEMRKVLEKFQDEFPKEAEKFQKDYYERGAAKEREIDKTLADRQANTPPANPATENLASAEDIAIARRLDALTNGGNDAPHRIRETLERVVMNSDDPREREIAQARIDNLIREAEVRQNLRNGLNADGTPDIPDVVGVVGGNKVLSAFERQVAENDARMADFAGQRKRQAAKAEVTDKTLEELDYIKTYSYGSRRNNAEERYLERHGETPEQTEDRITKGLTKQEYNRHHRPTVGRGTDPEPGDAPSNKVGVKSRPTVEYGRDYANQTPAQQKTYRSKRRKLIDTAMAAGVPPEEIKNIFSKPMWTWPTADQLKKRGK